MNKKIKIGILSTAMVALPIATVISCGKEEKTKPQSPKTPSAGINTPDSKTNPKPKVTKVTPKVKTTPQVQSVTIGNIFNILNEETIKKAGRKSILSKANMHFDSATSKNIYKSTNKEFIFDVSYPKLLIKSSRIKNAKPGKVLNTTFKLNKTEFDILAKFYTEIFMKYGKHQEKLPAGIKHDRKLIVELINKVKPTSHWMITVVE
ncbi:hypothetical protein [Mycoplasma todarodis]|uniref:hypothetical protein n=1 Tax=Mycoplasma todarodis TaxID=1937191 RepID=UPI003B3339F9